MPVWVWFVIAGVCLVAELFSGTFYLLIIGVAFGLAGIAAVFHAPFIVQLLIVLMASLGGLVMVRRSRLKAKKQAMSADADLVLDIGQKVSITHWHQAGEGYESVAKYRGASWQVSFQGNIVPQPGIYQIAGIDGSVLKVKMID